MNLRVFDLKMLSVSELRMLEFNLLYSIIADGKNEFLKNWCFTWMNARINIFRKKLLKTRYWTFLVVRYFTWNFSSNIFSMAVGSVVAFKKLSCLITIESAKEKCGTATHYTYYQQLLTLR